MAAGTCSSTDLTRQLDRIEKELKTLRSDVNSNHFKLNANLNGLADFLGKGKVSWIEIATMVASIVSAVAGIANIVQFWAQGAYLSKILKASTSAAQKANDAQYAAEVSSLKLDAVLKNQVIIQEKANNAEYAATRTSLYSQEIQRFLNNFGNSTVQNFRIIQEEIRRIGTSAKTDEKLNEIKSKLELIPKQIELIPQKINNLPALKEIPNKIKETTREVTRETTREIAKIPEQVGQTITRTIYTPLRDRIQEVSRQVGIVTREVTLQRDTTRYSDPKLDRILTGLTPLALIPANVAGLDSKINKLNNDLNQKISGLPGAVATANCNSGCSLAGAAARSRLETGQNALSNKLDALNAGLNASQLTLLKKIDGTTTKTLTQLGNPLKGGISGKLSRIGDVLSQSPVISWINLLVTLHNAGQLSASLVQSLGDHLSFGLNEFVFKDSEDQQIDVNQVIGTTVQGWIIRLVGVDRYNRFRQEMALWNNIYRSTANVIDTVRSIGDSTLAVSSLAAENSGKIGNALLRDRVIAEGSFNWMSENVTPSSAVLDRLNNLDDAANALSIVLSETANVINAKKELDEQTKKFESDLEALDPRTRPDNSPVKESQERDKVQAQSELIDENTITGVGSGQ
ncbi:hypothetical protein [Coleofasciculus sp.]|uniref:hypothetical protein n=1 Tax=Coleofasciculus sp. TaxID=3100458 RepID=UPI0039FAE741